MSTEPSIGLKEIKLGRVAMAYKGSYSSSATYNKLDIVTTGNGSYICLKDNVKNQAPTLPSYWGTLAVSNSNSVAAVFNTTGSVGDVPENKILYSTSQKVGTLDGTDTNYTDNASYTSNLPGIMIPRLLTYGEVRIGTSNDSARCVLRGNITINNGTEFSSKVVSYAPVTIQNILKVTGDASSSSNILTVASNVDSKVPVKINNTLTVTSNANIGGTLTITGNTNINGNIAINSNITFASQCTPIFKRSFTLPTGTVATTQGSFNNSTYIATTKYVDTQTEAQRAYWPTGTATGDGYHYQGGTGASLSDNTTSNAKAYQKVTAWKLRSIDRNVLNVVRNNPETGSSITNVTITIPSQGDVSLPNNFETLFINYTDKQKLNFQAASGVRIDCPTTGVSVTGTKTAKTNFTCTNLYGLVALKKINTNTWLIFGAID